MVRLKLAANIIAAYALGTFCIVAGAQPPQLSEITVVDFPACTPLGVRGQNLNPAGYVITNSKLCEEVARLEYEIHKELGSQGFEMRISGGDRYVDQYGLQRSSTNHSFVDGAMRSQHLSSDAVDIVFSGVSVSVILAASKNTAFTGYFSCDYPLAPHCHLSFPRK